MYSAVVCRYWEVGKCDKDERCRFRHSYPRSTGEVAAAAASSSSGGGGGGGGGSGSGGESTTFISPASINKPCKYEYNGVGNCGRGENCAYQHSSTPADENRRRRVHASSTSISTSTSTSTSATSAALTSSSTGRGRLEGRSTAAAAAAATAGSESGGRRRSVPLTSASVARRPVAAGAVAVSSSSPRLEVLRRTNMGRNSSGSGGGDGGGGGGGGGGGARRGGGRRDDDEEEEEQEEQGRGSDINLTGVLSRQNRRRFRIARMREEDHDEAWELPDEDGVGGFFYGAPGRFPGVSPPPSSTTSNRRSSGRASRGAGEGRGGGSSSSGGTFERMLYEAVLMADMTEEEKMEWSDVLKVADDDAHDDDNDGGRHRSLRDRTSRTGSAAGGSGGGGGGGDARRSGSARPCLFFQQGECRYGASCRNSHNTATKWELDEGAPERTEEEKRQLDVEEKSLSAEATCGICYENVSGLFGLLTACNHPFCLQCIRSWRHHGREQQDASTVRQCPLCRQPSYFVVPSARLVNDPIRKENLINKYKDAMGKIPCKLFREDDEASCPFGTSCFYAHLTKDGKVASRPLPRLKVDDSGRCAMLTDEFLSAFLY